MTTQSVLQSQYLSDNYFKGAARLPIIGPLKICCDGELRRTWTFASHQFDYSSFTIDIPTTELVTHIVNAKNSSDGDGPVVVFPHDSFHSTAYLKYVITKDTKWPTWIPIKNVRHHKLTFNNGRGNHCVWTFDCRHPECQTQIQVKVSLERAVVFRHSTSVIQIHYLYGQCTHWSHHWEGALTPFDIADLRVSLDFANRAPKDIWRDDLLSQQGSEKRLFCNVDGHFRNKLHLNNTLAKLYKEPVWKSLDVFRDIECSDQSWIAKLIQQGINYKVEDIGGEYGVDWDYIGWYHHLDFLNTQFAIYNSTTCDPLWQYPESWVDGLFIDDMSNLISNIWGRKLCHTIAFVRHPGERFALFVFEFVQGDWSQIGFETLVSVQIGIGNCRMAYAML
eukprot:57123_1